MLCLSVRQTQPHAYLSDANVDAPTNASVAFDHFVGLLILTVCVETVGSRLCSSYIYFVSSQYVSDPINSIIFSCALLACETGPVTCRPHVWLGVAQLRECSEASLCWLILLTVCVETVGSRLCSTYISFVSSQGVSDPINSIVFSCALLVCETDPVTCKPQLCPEVVVVLIAGTQI